MLPFRIRGITLLHNLVLGCASTVVFWVWIIAHFSVIRLEQIDWFRYSTYCFVVVGALVIDVVISKIRGTDLLQLDLRGALSLSMRQACTAFVAILLFLVAFKDHDVSRFFLFSFVPLLYATLLLLNIVVPRILARLLFLNKRREQTLLVGSTEQADRLLDWCKGKTLYGLDVIGLVTDDTSGAAHDFPVLGRIQNLEQVVAKNGATQLIALNSLDSVSLTRISSLSERLGLRLLLVSPVGSGINRPGSFTESGLHFVSYREEPLECPFNRLVKKTVDIVISVPIVLFVLPPVALVVYLIHRFQSPGPLFFRQERTGINFQSFRIYKFRTMHVDHGQEVRQATANDCRVFTLGRWLRKLSIDELPQFLNVLQGRMSIVGPRPHMIEHTEIFTKVASSFHVRSLVKPGITGLAQVRGFRGETVTKEDVLRRVASDVYYLENWSLAMEGAILFRTIGHVLRPPKTAF